MLPYFLHTRLKQILTQKYSQQPLTGHIFCWNCVWRWRFRPQQCYIGSMSYIRSGTIEITVLETHFAHKTH